MSRFILRPLLILLTLTMLVVALLQSAGRITFMFLDELEEPANQWLSARQIQVTGLRGDWHLLNPVVYVDRLEFPGGHVAAVRIEADWLESLLRNRFVVRDAVIGSGFVQLDRRLDGSWGLPGLTGDDQFDASGLLYHSDQLSASGSLVLSADGMFSEPMSIDYLATNRGGVHRHHVRVGNAEENGVGEFRYQVQEALWPLWPERRGVAVDASSLKLPELLLGGYPLTLDTLAIQWRALDRDSWGDARVELGGFDPVDSGPVTLSARASVRGLENLHWGRVEALNVSHGQTTVKLADVHVGANDQRLEFWMPELDLGEGASLAHQALGGIEIVDRWLGALQLGGRAANVRAFVDLQTRGFGYAATFADARLEGYKGVPYLRHGAGEVLGFGRGVRFMINTEDTVLHLPETFAERWPISYGQGVLDLWFKDAYIGLRGVNLRAETLASRAAGGFALSRPPVKTDERLTLLLSVDGVTLDQARAYIPRQLPQGLPEWLEEGPRSGRIANAHVAYQGQLHTRPGEPSRRFELTGAVSDAEVMFHEDWPLVSEVAGQLAVSGADVLVDVDVGTTAKGAAITNTQVRLVDNASYADVQLNVSADAAGVLGYVRGTPLQQWLDFIGPDWTATGPMAVSGWLHVPLKQSAGTQADALDPVDGDPTNDAGDVADADGFDASLVFELKQVDLTLPEYRMATSKLEGTLAYRYPYDLAGVSIESEIFGRPATVSATSGDDEVRFTISGSATHDDVLQLLDMNDPGVASGEFDYSALLVVALGAGAVSRVEVTSELVGLDVTLPAGYGKPAALPRHLDVTVEFLDGHKAVGFVYDDANGWLHVDEQPRRGAIGFAADPPMLAASDDVLVLAGRLQTLSLEEVMPEDDQEGLLSVIPVRLSDLSVDRILIDDFAIDNAVLNGLVARDRMNIDIDSVSVMGTVDYQGSSALNVTMAHVNLPPGDATGDPLNPRILAKLPDAVVRVEDFKVGAANYGKWQFDLKPDATGVRLANLQAELRGIKIVSEDGVYWHGDSHRSRFVGELTAGNLAEALPLWGYAPSVETNSARLVGALEWQGSPANVDLDVLVGEVSFRADDGRFLDVEAGQGALRLVGLINFSKVLKRINLDFSDVTGKGISFDKLKAVARFDEGSLEFTEPLEVEGSGSSFVLAGKVDLIGGHLDNELIVTLPVSKSLPWYAAYVALANPLAGLGMLVGERVLRKPIEQFSSAKYKVSGTVDEPQVSFVGVWDRSLKETDSTPLPGDLEGLYELEPSEATESSIPSSPENDKVANET